MAFAMGRPLVRAERDRFGHRRESGRRVAAMVIVLSGHLGLLMLMLRPAISDGSATAVTRNNSPALNLRFVRQPRPASFRLALRASRLVASTPGTHGTSTRTPSAQRAASAAAASETPSTSTPTPPGQYVSNEASTSDGGFQDRLRNAQRSYKVRGLPGSDPPYVAGIHLINPMNQGIGAVMRKAQRLFGVANRHCIDVEAWRQLTPQELSARHITPDDVDKVDEKYDCNRPPGLSF